MLSCYYDDFTYDMMRYDDFTYDDMMRFELSSKYLSPVLYD